MQTARTLIAAALLSTVALSPIAEARCYTKVIQRNAPVRDPHRITGTVLGAAIGGLLGRQVGDGKGRDLATVGGAVAGGVAGHKLHRYRQERNQSETVRICD